MSQTRWLTDEFVTTWDQFDERVRSKGIPLLRRLDRFPNSILITGCQRSGTTMLARVLTQSEGIVNYWFGPDDELDAALILSGYVEHQPAGRYCFQTTYINRRYHEYFEHDGGHKIVFILRNPFSVVCSMLYNWPEHALNRVFRFNGIPALAGADKRLFRAFGTISVSRLRRACWAYRGKISQLFKLQRKLSSERLMVIDYDDLVKRKETFLPSVYAFVDLKYRPEYAARIHARSVTKIDRLTAHEQNTIRSLCQPIYEEAIRLKTEL